MLLISYIFIFVINRHCENGREEFGNILDQDYICPLGHKHAGQGYCIYTGDFERDYFHGNGEFICLDGRRYKGEYRNNKRHGQVNDYISMV